MVFPIFPVLIGDNRRQISTLKVTNTAAQNSAAFAEDCRSASAAGKVLVIPAADYPFGSSVQAVASLTRSLTIDADGARFVVPSGITGVPFRISTESLWVDYDVSAFTRVGYGTDAAPDNLSTMAEFSAITLTGGPATMQQGEMVAIASNDLLDYGVEPEGVEINFQNCIGEVASYNAGVIYTSRALRRDFTPDNGTTRWCRLRRLNNKGIKLRIDGLVLTTNGDPFDTAITTRPDAVIEVVGFQNPELGETCRTEKAWAGDWRFKLTHGVVCEAGFEDLPNKPGNIDALGYSPAFYGANLNPMILRKTGQRSRHSTSIWRESPYFDLGVLTAGATTTFAYTKGTSLGASQSGTAPAVGDRIFVQGLVGTISVLNNTWQTITARTGTNASGTITFAFNSTGLARTSGGTAKLFEPDQAFECYGEREGCYTQGGYVFGSTGSYIDSHQNDLYEIVDGMAFDGGTGNKGSSAEGRPLNIRGANGTYRDLKVRGFAQLADFAAFGGTHAAQNTITLDGGEFRDQAGRGYYSGTAYGGRGALIINEGDASVTDTRLAVVKDWDFINIFTLVNWVADGGNLILQRCNVRGDWGPGSGLAPGEEMIKITGNTSTQVTVDGGVWDFSSALASRIRLAQVTGGRLTLRGLRIRNLFCTSSQYPILLDGAGTILDIEDCVIELGSATSQRLINVTNAATINFRGNNRIINSANLTANSVITTSAALTINMFGELRGDAAGMDLFSGAGAVTVNDLRQTTPLT